MKKSGSECHLGAGFCMTRVNCGDQTRFDPGLYLFADCCIPDRSSHPQGARKLHRCPLCICRYFALCLGKRLSPKRVCAWHFCPKNLHDKMFGDKLYVNKRILCKSQRDESLLPVNTQLSHNNVLCEKASICVHTE